MKRMSEDFVCTGDDRIPAGQAVFLRRTSFKMSKYPQAYLIGLSITLPLTQFNIFWLLYNKEGWHWNATFKTSLY
jgi:hypothetical protein